MIHTILRLSPSIRYVAIYRDGKLETNSRAELQDSSTSESDRYEELIVNPTLLRLTTQRGEIDCGGLRYVVVRYGSFFQFVYPTTWGHASVCIEKHADPIGIGELVADALKSVDPPSE